MADSPTAAPSVTNPVLTSENRLKLGLFGLNGAASMTTAPEATTGDWPYSVRVSRMADAAGFEANVPYARWKGYVESLPTHPTGIALDCYTWAAGTSQVVDRSAIFTTSHVPTMHPVAAAKACATIDQMSGGRLGLNVVAGWNKPELDMFGSTWREHDDRYDQAAEWIDIVKRLWTADEAFDYEGTYYQIKRGVSLPHPLQKPFPPIMNAGGSERGRQFAAKYSDLAFVLVHSDKMDEAKAQTDLYRRIAWEDYGRKIQVWTFAYVVVRDTDQEAQDFVNYYAVEKGDQVALNGWMQLQGSMTKLMSPEQLEKFRYRFLAGQGGYELVGTPDRIVERVANLSKAGIDGVLLFGVGMDDIVRRWCADVMPRLVQAGLRRA